MGWFVSGRSAAAAPVLACAHNAEPAPCALYKLLVCVALEPAAAHQVLSLGTFLPGCAGAQAAGGAPPLLVSGAGHDAMVFAEVTKMGMLFVRCK